MRRSAIGSILRLLSRDPKAYHRPGEELIQGHRPNPDCQLEVSKLDSSQTRVNHVHACCKRLARLKASEQFIIDHPDEEEERCSYFCFSCSLWVFRDEEWRQHCEWHLAHLDIRCGVLTIRGSVATAAYCPFCLGSEQIPAPQRIRQFAYPTALSEHIGIPLQELPLPHCPHPLCRRDFNDLDSLRYHLSDIYCLKNTYKHQVKKGVGKKKSKQRNPIATSPPIINQLRQSHRLFEGDAMVMDLDLVQHSTAQEQKTTTSFRDFHKPSPNSKELAQSYNLPSSNPILINDGHDRVPSQNANLREGGLRNQALDFAEDILPQVTNSAKDSTGALHRHRSAAHPEQVDPHSNIDFDCQALFPETDPFVNPWSSIKSDSRSASAEVDILPISSIATPGCGQENTKESARCPICQKDVQPELLKAQKSNSLWKVKDQIEFCHFHRKNSAKLEWSKLQYPEIDWTVFDARPVYYENQIGNILRSAVMSRYRTELQEKRRGSRRFRLEDSSFKTGYYGA